MRSLSWEFSAVVAFSAGIRFLYIGQFPPGSDELYLLRLMSACSGVLSIGLLMRVLQQILRQEQTAWWAGLALTLMPWHIEQSRVFSPALIGLTLLLLGTYAYLRIKRRISRVVIVVLTVIVFFWAYPVYQPVFEFLKQGQVAQVIDHVGYLTSGEFLFYKNETFWAGGMRTVGVFLPATAGIVLIGAYESARRVRWSHLPWIGVYLMILMTASMNARFPEGSHYFLATP